MALVHTPDGEISSPCPSFELPDIYGKTVSLSDLQAQNPRGLLVMFICNHCPYVQAIEERLIKLSQNAIDQKINVVAICSNDWHRYPDDSPKMLRKRSEEMKFPFIYLVDETQKVAKQFGAVCTPDLYLYDANFKLYYRGRLDDSWKDPSQVKTQDLSNAIQDLLGGNPPPETQHSSMGCSIKWREGV
ncbi:MAG: thioredoxin family protein [Bdellovibrionales bacterium CG10_big_fil_rev_8_21_14_0_10_45_34]|nr:MAG: thioredoxin family protein [Bdellovibrionales bacterium CG10_big_fil_rev_8_21_14_0_10_45_34]